MNFSLYEVVQKLVGQINPVGDSVVDAARYENLEVFLELLDDMLIDLYPILEDANRPEASIRRAGQRVERFIVNLRESLS